jgi:hypothetical protein
MEKGAYQLTMVLPITDPNLNDEREKIFFGSNTKKLNRKKKREKVFSVWKKKQTDAGMSRVLFNGTNFHVTQEF